MAAASASGCSHEITYEDETPACETLLGIIKIISLRKLYSICKKNHYIMQKCYIKTILMMDYGSGTNN